MIAPSSLFPFVSHPHCNNPVKLLSPHLLFFLRTYFFFFLYIFMFSFPKFFQFLLCYFWCFSSSTPSTSALLLLLQFQLFNHAPTPITLPHQLYFKGFSLILKLNTKSRFFSLLGCCFSQLEHGYPSCCLLDCRRLRFAMCF